GERFLTVAVKNIARRLGDDISESKPILDSRLPDGSRVAAVFPPCSLGGVTLTIRKFDSRHFEIEDLIRTKTLDRRIANLLEDYVQKNPTLAPRGPPAPEKPTPPPPPGKLTPPDERILLTKAPAEIQLPHNNRALFEPRHEQNGIPAVPIRDLLKA